MGETGAAWVRVANELANVSIDYDKIVERLTTAWESDASTAVARKLAEFGEWLRAVSLGAAANGQRAEEAAVANTVAVLAMPSVSEAKEAKAAHDMMASLAAYNGAILNGNFAEFDEAARADHADASAVMRQYENAVTALAQPWEQPLPQEVSKGQSLRAEEQARSGGEGVGGGGGAAGGGVGSAAMPLAAWKANGVGSSTEPKTLQRTAFSGGGAGGAGMGGAPYAPMAGYGRGGDQDRDHESTQLAGSLAGAGEPTSGLSDADQAWLPNGAHNDSPFVVSAVSWGPDTAVFDELALPASPEADGFADEPHDTLERVSDRWVAPAVIGHDRRTEL